MRKLLLGFALLCLALGCSAGTESPEPPPVGLAPPSWPPAVHFRYGFPGSWWRPGATEVDFGTGLRTCRAESATARSSDPEVDPADLAYRGFLDCMGRLEWTRGAPPAQRPSANGNPIG